MNKVPVGKLLDIVALLDRANNAINTLEKFGSNRAIYPELKKELQDLSLELKDRYSLREFTDPEERNRLLDRQKAIAMRKEGDG